MGDFYETERFPEDFKVGSTFGLMFDVDTVTAGRGLNTISRFKRSALPVKTFNLAHFMVKGPALSTLQNWLYAMGGPFTGFRLKDLWDYKSCDWHEQIALDDQLLGVADGTAVDFQLAKTYGVTGKLVLKPILKPVAGNVLVGVNGALQVEDTDYTLDTTTGVITFTDPPTNGNPITAGYEYDTPVIFQDNEIDSIAYVDTLNTEVKSLRFIELLNP